MKRIAVPFVAAAITLGAAACSSNAGPLLVENVYPRAAGAAGTLIIVRGEHFASGAQVQIGSNSLATTWVNSRYLAARLPAGLPAGAADVIVRNPDGAQARLSGGLVVGSATATATPPAATATTTTLAKTPSPTSTPSPSPTPTPTPSPTPSPTSSPSPTPTPTPTRTPTPSPSPTPTPPPSPTRGPTPVGLQALEAIVCQPAQLGGQQPVERTEVTNAALGEAGADLATLGRQDGFRVTYATAPGAGNGRGRGQDQNQAGSSRTTCYVEVYATDQGAAQALELVGDFPDGWSMQEVPTAVIGQGARAFQGTMPGAGGRSVPVAEIVWRNNRFLASVTVAGIQETLARQAALLLAQQMDMRMLPYR
jgi:outer membrane biosynthesis protein TonB